MLDVVVVAVVDGIVPGAADAAAGARTGIRVAVTPDALDVVNTFPHSPVVVSGRPGRGPAAVRRLGLAGAQQTLARAHLLLAGGTRFSLGRGVVRRKDGVLGVESLGLLLNVLP
jgi:hypothetical protein